MQDSFAHGARLCSPFTFENEFPRLARANPQHLHRWEEQRAACETQLHSVNRLLADKGASVDLIFACAFCVPSWEESSKSSTLINRVPNRPLHQLDLLGSS